MALVLTLFFDSMFLLVVIAILDAGSAGSADKDIAENAHARIIVISCLIVNSNRSIYMNLFICRV